jgi:hypothetical protein
MAKFHLFGTKAQSLRITGRLADKYWHPLTLVDFLGEVHYGAIR